MYSFRPYQFSAQSRNNFSLVRAAMEAVQKGKHTAYPVMGKKQDLKIKKQRNVRRWYVEFFASCGQTGSTLWP